MVDRFVDDNICPVIVCIDHFRNDVTHSALFARLFSLAKGIHVIHCVIEKTAVGDMPVSCCAVTAQTISCEMLALDLIPF